MTGGAGAARRIEVARAAWGVGYVVVGAALATAIAWPVYASSRMILVAAAGTVLGAGIALASRLLRWGPWLTALAAALAYVVAVPLVAIPTALTSPGELLRGVRDGVLGVAIGWKQLLTLKLPLGDYQAVLVPFFVVVFVGVLAATLLVSGRGRWAPLAVPVVVAMAAFGVVFGPASVSSPIQLGPYRLSAPREILLGVALLLVSFLWLAVRARMARARALRVARSSAVRQSAAPAAAAVRRGALAAGVVLVALGVGFAAAPAAGQASRSVLRQGVDPMVVVQKQLSPLAAYRSWFDAANFDAPLFTVDHSSGVSRIRLAVLDSYDGQDFTVGDTTRFTRLPRTQPDAQAASTLTVTIDSGYRGIWVPVPPRVDAAPTFSGPRAGALENAFYLGADDATAINVLPGPGGSQGLRAGDTYTVPGKAPVPAGSFDEDKGGSPLVSAKEYPALAAWVALQSVPRTGAGVTELVQRLRQRGYLTHGLIDDANAQKWMDALRQRSDYSFQSSYSGHSVARIEQLFNQLTTQQKSAGAGADAAALVAAPGDDEQFSVAAALVARYLGFPSRVVLGVRLGGAGKDSGVAPCTRVCTGANMSAWVQVQAEDRAWVTLDTTPQFQNRPVDIKRSEQLPQNPTVPDQPHSKSVDPPPAQGDKHSPAAPVAQPGADLIAALLPILRAVGIGALIVLLVLLPALTLALVKAARRRSRRGAASAEVRMVGAWEELVDAYLDHGIPIPSHGTRAECATAIGRPGAMALAALVDRAVFARHAPVEAAGDESWRRVDEERAALGNGLSVWRRLAAALNPASLVRRAPRLLPRSDWIARRKEGSR